MFRAAWFAASAVSAVSEFCVQTEPEVPKYPLVSALGIFSASGKGPRFPRLLLSYPACRPQRYIVVCGRSGFTIAFHIFS